MRAHLSLLGLIAVVGALGCTTSADGPPESGEGPFVTLNGGSFDKLTLNAADGAGVMNGGQFRALVEDKASICSTSALRQRSTVLTIETPNTVKIAKLDATCGNEQEYVSESGTVTITSSSSTVVTGSFDVTLANGAGTLKGTFNIPICPGLKLDTCDP